MTKLYLSMPQPGETITEGMIVAWIAKAGDEVREGTPLAELETEKAVFEYESPFEGRVLQLLYPAESRVKVGEPIAVMEVSAERAEHYLMLGIASLATEGGGETVAEVSVGGADVVAGQVAGGVPASVVATADIRDLNDIKMSPYVRRLALEHGIGRDELIRLAGEDAEARVTKEALKTLVGSENVPSSGTGVHGDSAEAGRKALRDKIKPIVPPDPETAYAVMPFSPIRMRIAENMALSKQKIPHAHTGLTVDVTRVVSFRDEHKEAFHKKNGVSLNYLSLFYPAIIKAVKKYPSVNASYVEDGDKPEIRLFQRINLGIAVGSDYGLIIPVMRHIENMDFRSFNQKLNDKVVRGMKKKLKPEDYFGATLIFNNFGFFGTSIGVQIIQYPLAATLGMGVIEKRVMPLNGGIAVRDVADFFIAFDHRILDGREAGLFLTELKREIENLPLTAELLGG